MPIRIAPGCRTPALALLVLALAACAALDRRDAGPERVTFELSHGSYLLDPGSFELTEVDAALAPGDLRLEFLLVRGAINGAPEREVFRSIPVERGAEFELRLPATIPGEVPAFESADLRIEPADIRVVRLGTFHYHPEYGVFRGGGGFVHEPSGDAMLLVHFSAPARVRGTRNGPGGRYRYAVAVERAGWAWLIAEAQPGGGFAVRRYTGPIDDIEFAVLLPPLMLYGAPE